MTPSPSQRGRARRRQGGSTAEPRSTQKSGPRKSAAMVFVAGNYLLILLGLALVTVGYVIMRMENEVDGFISLYIAPILILGGYLEVIYAILWRPKTPAPPTETPAT
ncbi:MAG: hypothetical protein SH809_17785 [Rhodothermales bacterium]|nr:hypothetical protein [Rhodothermales bacterium]